MENSGECILTVHQDDAFRQSVQEYLEDTGFVAYGVPLDAKAFDVFLEKSPDLILIQLHMAEDSGWILLDKCYRKALDVPIIVIFAKEEIEYLFQAIHRGASDYLIEPMQNMAVLEHTVCRALERGRLVRENKRYRDELEEKNKQLSRSLAQLKEDHEAAETVQEHLLPLNGACYGHYQCHYKILPSLYLSGDSVGYFSIDSTTMAFYIMDVSGHGASSAIVTILIKNLIEQLLLSYRLGKNQDILQPGHVLKHISDVVLKLKLGKYLTMVFGLIDQKTDQLLYSIGGHYPYPMLMQQKEVQCLKEKSFLLGIAEKATFETKAQTLLPGAQLYIFSDGIFEVIVGKNLSEKEEKLRRWVEQSKGDLATLLKYMEFEENKNYPDDITVFLIRRSE